MKLSDRGWDNGNYLDALGGGQESIDEANARYERESQARAAMREKQFKSMVHDVSFEEVPENNNQDNNFMGFGEESPIPVPNAGVEENPGGGDRFRKMMEQAKTQQGQFPGAQAQQQMQQQVQQYEQQQQQQQQASSMPIQTPTPPPQQMPMGQQAMDPQGYYQALQAWQQAMVTFQQFSAANPEAASQMTPPPPPPPPPTFNEQMPQQTLPQQQYQAPMPQQEAPQQQYNAPQQQQQPEPQVQPIESNDNGGTPKSIHDYLPQRAGGNKDAYEVNNPADLYFAQLKRDSTIRTEARKRGDLETANSPFTEEGVIALGGFFSDELIQRRREQLSKNGGEFETSRDEMILPAHFIGDEGDSDKTYSGQSYKQKLMEAKKQKSSN